MKKVHYQNIGFPRTGTTWLWQSLISHPEVFKSTNVIKTRNFIHNNKEPRFKLWTTENIVNRIPEDVTPIVEKYKDYDISLCFNTFDFRCTTEEISRIESYTTHASITLRNPFEIVSNYYAYVNNNDEFPTNQRELYTVDYLTNDLFDFANTVERWFSFKNKFKVFVYDDLVEDKASYYKDVCEFIGLEPNNSTAKKINSISLYTDNYVPINFTDEQCMILNNNIDKLSSLLNRDFTHWKEK